MYLLLEQAQSGLHGGGSAASGAAGGGGGAPEQVAALSGALVLAIGRQLFDAYADRR